MIVFLGKERLHVLYHKEDEFLKGMCNTSPQPQSPDIVQLIPQEFWFSNSKEH